MSAVRRPRQVHIETIDGITIKPDRRPVNQEAVNRLAESMKEIGMRVPISVRHDPVEEEVLLVTGAHRLAAAKKLGWERVEAFWVEGDEIDARLEEIAENLHRAELTELERSEQIDEWRKLVKQKVVQVAPPSKNAQPKESGVRKTAEKLGVPKRQVQRATTIASLYPEAKEAAREAGLDDNQSALLGAAKHDTPEAQVHYLETRKAKKRAAEPLNDLEAREQQVAALMSAWNKASSEARQEFLSRIDRPVMDNAEHWS